MMPAHKRRRQRPAQPVDQRHAIHVCLPSADIFPEDAASSSCNSNSISLVLRSRNRAGRKSPDYSKQKRGAEAPRIACTALVRLLV